MDIQFMKDYYDLYYLITYKEFSKENLKNAVIKTFNNIYNFYK